MPETERSIERELVIAADAETVWRALTEGDQIKRWFAIEAESDPRPGGVIRVRWNPDAEFSDMHIVGWEPNAQLRLTWYASIDPDRELPLEIRLQRAEGGTLLRLVHSGFLSDASWDDEFDSHGRGWSYELRSLKYYLEHQLGRTRQAVSKRLPVSDAKDAWRALVGPQGLFKVDGEILDGARVDITLPTGEKTSATIFFALADTDFVAIADVLQGGLFRLSLETFAGQPEIYFWAMSWQLAQSQLEKLVVPCLDVVHDRLHGLRPS